MGTCFAQPKAWEVIYETDTHWNQIEFFDSQNGLVGGLYRNHDPYYTLLRTTDGGYTWEGVLTWDQIKASKLVFYNRQYGFIADGAHAAVTTNGGETWDIFLHSNAVISYPAYIDSLNMIATFWSSLPNDLYANFMYRSYDSGYTWEQIRYEIRDNSCYNQPGVTAEGTILLWVGDDLWRSTDIGDTWTITNSEDLPAYALSQFVSPCSSIVHANARRIVQDTYQPVILRSIDDGLTWEISWADSSVIRTMLIDMVFSDSLHGWVTGENGLIVQTSDGGETWTSYFLEESAYNISELSFIDSTLGWGVDPGGAGTTKIFRFGEAHSTNTIILPALPVKPTINAIYPNPFNSITTLTLSLPGISEVEVNLYDVMGRYVRSVVQERMTAGENALRVDAAGLPSGVYFVKATAGEYKAVKKVVLLK
ncbi:T9SS type A sorting domain-containing protein [bacterium]|nr:T9SS type A sorting domain-containing protein [bacterium]